MLLELAQLILYQAERDAAFTQVGAGALQFARPLLGGSERRREHTNHFLQPFGAVGAITTQFLRAPQLLHGALEPALAAGQLILQLPQALLQFIGDAGLAAQTVKCLGQRRHAPVGVTDPVGHLGDAVGDRVSLVGAPDDMTEPLLGAVHARREGGGALVQFVAEGVHVGHALAQVVELGDAGVGQVERGGDAIDVLPHALDQGLQRQELVHLDLERPGRLVAA